MSFIRSLPVLLMLLAVVGVASIGCRLTGASGDVGEKCQDSSDCTDNDHGCVPIDETNPNGTRVCMPPAPDWICKGNLFGDTVCDCGCEFQDIDCPSLLSSACAANGNNCPNGQNPLAVDNTKCQ